MSSTSTGDGAANTDSLGTSAEGTSSETGGATDATMDGSSDGSTTTTGFNEDTTGEGSSSSDGAEDTGTGETDDGVVVGELPFGGYVRWTYFRDPNTGGFSHVASARFFELEDPDSQLSVLTQPVGDPRTEDEWQSELNHTPGDFSSGLSLADGETAVPYDPGSPVVVRGTNVEGVLVSDGLGLWEMDMVSDLADYAGGAWSIEIPGEGVFPAAQLDDVIPGGPSVGDVNFELVGDPVTGFTWDPRFSAVQEILLVVYGTTPDDLLNPFALLCIGHLVNDGEAEFPPGCIGQPGTAWRLQPFLHFRSDVAYDGRRIRISSRFGTALQSVI